MDGTTTPCESRQLLHDVMARTTFPWLLQVAAFAAGKGGTAALCGPSCGYLYHLLRRLWPETRVLLLLRPNETAPEATAFFGFDRAFRRLADARKAPFHLLSADPDAEFANLGPWEPRLRTLSRPFLEAFVAALDRFDAPPPRPPKDLPRLRLPPAFRAFAAFFKEAAEPLAPRLPWDLGPLSALPQAYVISQQEERRRHALEVLESVGFRDVRVVAPVAADDAARSEALRTLGVDGGDARHRCGLLSSCCLSRTQASHLLTYARVLDEAPEPWIFVFEDDVVPLWSVDEVGFQLRVCSELSGAQDFADAVFFEWCYGYGAPCGTPSTFKGFAEAAPLGGQALCTAAVLWGPGRRNVLKALPAAAACGPTRLLSQGLTTDGLLQRLRARGDFRARYYGPLFEQAREIFGSRIQGSWSIAAWPCLGKKRRPELPWTIAARRPRAYLVVATVLLVAALMYVVATAR